MQKKLLLSRVGLTFQQAVHWCPANELLFTVFETLVAKMYHSTNTVGV